MSSKIEKELVEVTDLSTKRGEDRQAYLKRLVVAVSELSDKDWEGLSKDAQDWYNNAADAQNAKKALPDFEEEETPAPTTRRRKSGDDDETSSDAGKAVEVKAKDVKVDMPLTITTKRGKTETGHVVEVDDDVVVIKLGNGEEVEFNFDRIETMTTLAASKSSGRKSGDDETEADPIKVGAKVTVVTKRGKEYTGEIVEMDDEVLVLDCDGKEEELARDRVESIKLAGGKAKAEEKTSSRRGAKDEGEKGESKRSTNNGVSIGTRIKELIADNLDADEAAIAKLLKKEGLEFRENTLNLNYKDCHKFIEILKERKMLKA